MQNSSQPAVDEFVDPADYVQSLVETGLNAEDPIAATPTHVRSQWLEQVSDLVSQNSEELAELIVKEGIKTIREARSEVGRASNTLKLSAEEAKRHNGESIAFDQYKSGENRTGWTENRPVGLVGAITPFNDPLNLVAHKVGPAIAAGCPVIVKPHHATPGPARKLSELFLDAGMPAPYFQVLDGAGSGAGKLLVDNPAVRMLTFTGGESTGCSIARAAAGRPVSLELGGICSTIVLADADLNSAPKRIVSGMFAAAGQNCLHVQRLLVADEVYDSLLEQLVGLTGNLRLGDPMSEDTDMGSLISEDAARQCEEFVSDATSLGGSVVTGGKRHGLAFEPTILVDTPETARIHQEEVFGPITVIDRIEGLDQAVARLKNAKAALATGLFTRDIAAPFALRSIKTGSIMVNDSSDFRIDAMPFGGPYPAGLSREGIRYAMDSMTETLLICVNLN